MYNNGLRRSKRKTPKSEQEKLIAKLDRVFSLYIRLRDTMPSGFFRCISCGQIKPFSQADCGHFFRRELKSTRFDERNASAECKFCNRIRQDHLVDYQVNLIAKIGQGEFDKLNVLRHSTKHWLPSELEERIAYYRKESIRLAKEKGIKINV